MNFSETLDIMGKPLTVKTPRHPNLAGILTPHKENGSNCGVDLILDVSSEFGKPMIIVYRHLAYETLICLNEKDGVIVAGLPRSLIKEEEFYDSKNPRFDFLRKKLSSN